MIIFAQRLSYYFQKCGLKQKIMIFICLQTLIWQGYQLQEKQINTLSLMDDSIEYLSTMEDENPRVMNQIKRLNNLFEGMNHRQMRIDQRQQSIQERVDKKVEERIARMQEFIMTETTNKMSEEIEKNVSRIDYQLSGIILKLQEIQSSKNPPSEEVSVQTSFSRQSSPAKSVEKEGLQQQHSLLIQDDHSLQIRSKKSISVKSNEKKAEVGKITKLKVREPISTIRKKHPHSQIFSKQEQLKVFFPNIEQSGRQIFHFLKGKQEETKKSLANLFFKLQSHQNRQQIVQKQIQYILNSLFEQIYTFK